MYQYNGKTIETDKEGYLLNHTDWQEDSRAMIAKQRRSFEANR